MLYGGRRGGEILPVASCFRQRTVNADEPISSSNLVDSSRLKRYSTKIAWSSFLGYPFNLLFPSFRRTNSFWGTPTEDSRERFKKRNSHSKRWRHVCVLSSQQKPSRVSLSQMEVLQKCLKWVWSFWVHWLFQIKVPWDSGDSQEAQGTTPSLHPSPDCEKCGVGGWSQIHMCGGEFCWICVRARVPYRSRPR